MVFVPALASIDDKVSSVSDDTKIKKEPDKIGRTTGTYCFFQLRVHRHKSCGALFDLKDQISGYISDHQDPYGSVYSRTDPGKRLYPVEDHCQRKNDTWNGIGQRSTFFHGHSPFTVSSYFHIGCCSSHNNTDSTSHKCQKDTVSDSGKNTSVCKYKSKITFKC